MLRVDALATRYVFHPLQRLRFSQQPRIPILMYHSISRLQKATSHPYFQTITSPQVFARHMSFLHDHRYSSITLNEAVNHMHAAERACTKPVVITFDDGYRDFYSQAFPILNRYGFSATVFLPTAYIGDTSRGFNGTECLTWSQVRELKSAGVHFGSHTVTHPKLKHLSVEDVQYEVRCSKETIEDKLGSPVRSFAYPYAFPEADRAFRQRLQDVLEHTGYKNGVSTIIGTADRKDYRFFMKRLPVNAHDDPRLFKAKLEGAYDWVHTVQYASKRIAVGS